MKNNFLKIHKNLLLTILAILLLLIFIFSSAEKNKSDRRKKISTALLNPKYVEKIDQLELKSSEGEIYLSKNRNFWTIKTSENDYEIPANKKTIEEFLADLSKIINLYKVSDLKTSNYNLFFPENSNFSVKYKISSGENTTLFFGRYDFSQNFRYLMTDKNTSIYELNTQLDKYLNTSYQVWAEPYLISQNIIGKISESDIQRILFYDKTENKTASKDSSLSSFENIKHQLLELRHGGKINKNILITETPVYEIKIELGNKKEIFLSFYPLTDTMNNNENNYLVKINYDNNLIFNYRISLWTYNKIKEMML